MTREDVSTQLVVDADELADCQVVKTLFIRGNTYKLPSGPFRKRMYIQDFNKQLKVVHRVLLSEEL